MSGIDLSKRVGVVAIGRNEGARLEACLRSCAGRVAAVVYVDSGSTDDSPAVARRLGVEVVELDTAAPFTAARARNAGVERLIGLHPTVEYVQVVDGDCELAEGWLATAAGRLDADAALAVVCGRRRERFPQASVYNRLIDMEWNTPVGRTKACGGDAMIRGVALRQVGGFNGELICGEEPELCVRLRAAGYAVERLDAEMTLHDAGMTRLGQWWRRCVRGGWASAEASAMHGKPPERHGVRMARSNWLWGAIVPAVALGAAWPTRGWSLLLLLGYLVLGWRVYRHRRGRGDEPKDARLYALFTVLGKLPNVLGQLRYWITRLSGRRARLIEYKAPTCA